MSWTAVSKTFGCLATIVFAVFVSDANGTMLVSDTFSYANGNLVPNDPPIGGAWNAHSGAGVTPVLVSSGTISLAQGGGTREDVNAPFEGGFTLGAGGVLYSGFDLTVADPGVAITDVYFAHFLQGTASFDARIWITAPTAGGYRLAISNDNSITDADGEVFTGDLAFGTKYRIVEKYDFDNKSGQLWINPVNQGSASITATDPGFSDAIAAYAFRQATGVTNHTIDNLYVSTTFQGALNGVEVPEPAALALLAVGGLLAVCRRQRIG